MRKTIQLAMLLMASIAATPAVDQPRAYNNQLTPIRDPAPLLADHREFIEPVRDLARYQAAALVDDEHADLHVRAWRYSYNARGIIEIPNHLRASETAVIVVHPWGIDDGQGWNTPQPAGVADFCTTDKNNLAARHTRQVVNPFLKSLRKNVALVMYSLPGDPDPIRRKMYRSTTTRPTEAERRAGAQELAQKLKSFSYAANSVPQNLNLSSTRPVIDYLQQFPGTDSGDHYNPPGFWSLPIPVTRDIDVDPDDVVIYDAPGYDPLKQFLQANKIRHVLLCGYATDMCYCRTTAGYENLSKDFNVFLVGDATLATFPASDTPRCATNAAICAASLDHLITQVSWIKLSR